MSASMFSPSRQLIKLQFSNISRRVFPITSKANFSRLSARNNKGTDILNGQSSLYKEIRLFHASKVLCGDEVRVVKTPQFADSITEGDVTWAKLISSPFYKITFHGNHGQTNTQKAVGDYVKEDEIVGEIETDKTSIGVPAPAAGYVVELLAEDGATVQAGQDIYKLRLSADGPSGGDVAKPAEAVVLPPTTPSAPPSSSTAGVIPSVAPAVPKVSSTPIASKPAASVVPVKAAAASTGPASPALGSRTESRVKMSRIRQKISSRLKEAQNTCAMLTTFNEIDMSNIMELRVKYKDNFLKKHNVKLGFMSAFVKACSYSLTQQPIVNAVIEDKTIVYRDYHDISVAVSSPKGLVVPVLRDVQSHNFADIERNLTALGEKARSDNLAIEDMDGGTFTISNGGVFGSMFGTPIINPPQSAILGMHAIFQRPVAIDGKVEIRPMMYVALTYDHRLIDGREAVTFLKSVKSTVEDPRILLLDL